MARPRTSMPRSRTLHACVYFLLILALTNLALDLLPKIQIGEYMKWNSVKGNSSTMEAPKKSERIVTGTRWAILVAGSKGYADYRHQANLCHAYQLLKKRGFKDENIIVFMFDDIAMNERNPKPGIIVNHPLGDDVYTGVPKGRIVTAITCLLSFLIGLKDSVKGGSGKVVNSTASDTIFFFYTDHGSPGSISMPTKPNIFAKELNEVLEKKHAMGTYEGMLIFMEACFGGSMFQDHLKESLNIYAIVSASANQSSWNRYCPFTKVPTPRHNYGACLAGVFSEAWMFDLETRTIENDTLGRLFEKVKEVTHNNRPLKDRIQTVVDFGAKEFKLHKVSKYLGSNPELYLGLDREIGNVSFQAKQLLYVSVT